MRTFPRVHVGPWAAGVAGLACLAASTAVAAGVAAPASAAALAPARAMANPAVPHLKSASNTTSVFRNAATGRCLQSDRAHPKLHQGDVFTIACSGGKWQKWHVVPSARYRGTYVITSAVTNWCLDSDTHLKEWRLGNVYTHRCNGGKYQAWAPAAGPKSGAYTLTDLATHYRLTSNDPSPARSLAFTFKIHGNGANQGWQAIEPGRSLSPGSPPVPPSPPLLFPLQPVDPVTELFIVRPGH